MNELIPDFDSAQLRQISNDTYFFFTRGEEPLDEANQEEIQELQDEFPQGFQLMDEYELVEGTDLVEVLLVPYISYQEEQPETSMTSPEYDYTLPMFNDWEVRYREVDEQTVHAFYYHPLKGITHEGDYQVQIKNGNKFIAIGKSIYPLKRFTPF